MKVGRRSRVASVALGMLVLLTGAVTTIGLVLRLQDYAKSSLLNGGLKELRFCEPKSPVVPVEELGCISLRFWDVKGEDFSIEQAACGENSERLYLEFVINTLGGICDLEDEAGVIEEEDIMRREKESLKILICEIRYNLCENSRLVEAKSTGTCTDASSTALRRFLGLDMEFPSGQDLEAVETGEMVKVIETYWPRDLNGVKCKIFTKVLSLKSYVASILARYFIECKIERQKRMERDSDVLMSIEMGRALGDKNVSPFVILSGKGCLSPGAYMNVIREILFFTKYKSIISNMNAEESGSSRDISELWFLLQKCKGSFNRKLSDKFRKLFEKISRDISMSNSDRSHAAYRTLMGFLGLTEGFQNGATRQIKDQDMPVFEYYRNLLSSLVDEKAYYHILDTRKTIKVKDYMASLLLRGYKGRVYKLAAKLEGKEVSKMEVKGGFPQMKHYLWFLVRLIHDAEVVDRKTGGKFKDELGRLRENFILCIELVVHGGKIYASEPSTKAVLKLVGIGKNTDTCTAGAEDEHGYMFEGAKRHGPSRNGISSAGCILDRMDASLGKYAAAVVSQYLRECKENSRAQEDVDLKVFRSMNEDFSMRYEDGKPVGVEYFEMVRNMLCKVFCSEIEGLLRGAMLEDSFLSNTLKYYLDCKVRNVCNLFSRAFLAVEHGFHTDEKKISAHDVTMIKRILGKDKYFMRSTDLQEGSKRLFKSVLSKFPRKYKKIRCWIGDREFELVYLIAKAVTEYLRIDTAENCRLVSELERSPICNAAFYDGK
ncbi:hypothetical protein KMI_04g06560 [Encephalitozoon hellem]|nr:hypothetical protein KMI_04g06560 [Encephalitozoon hellem]